MESLHLLLLALHLGSWHCYQLLWIRSLIPRLKHAACSHHLGDAVQTLHVLSEESNKGIKQQGIRGLSEKRSISVITSVTSVPEFKALGEGIEGNSWQP